MDKSLLPNIYEFISKTYPFSQLSELEKDATATKIQITYHSPGDVLEDETLAGAGLFMVRAGVVETRYKNDGSLRGRFSVGDTFGFTQMDKEGKSDYKAVFLENTLLYLLPRTVLHYLIEKNKAVGDYFDSKEWVRLSSSHNYADEISEEEKQSSTFKSIDSVCNHDLAIVTPSTSIVDTAIKLGEHNADMAVVIEYDELKGVVTKSDITLKAVAKSMDINSPINEIMTRNIMTIDANQSVYDALEMMVMYDIKNIPVMKNNKVFGTVSTTSLLQNSQLQTVYLCQELQTAKDVNKIISLSKQKKEIFETLVTTNVKPHTIQKVMSHIADNFAQAFVRIAEDQLGRAPVDYAFVAAGSQARSEVQFLSDQDNCIITKTELTDEQREYFVKLAKFVTENLDKCGYPLCDGNFMASNPRWVASLDTWKSYYTKWISDTDQDAILSSSVFLDMRCLYGHTLLVKQLRMHLIETAKNNSRFMATLMNISSAVSPPVGTFRQFVLTKDGDNKPYLNIKKQAINLIIEMARLYGICAQTDTTDTYERLKAAVKADLLKEEDYKELSEAYTFLNSVRFNHQLKSMKNGEKLSNNIVPNDLSQFERNHLRDAFQIIAKHQKGALFRFSGGRGVL
ncbi:MAG: CBS domain-containing protein [Succinivibrio sp.]|nr:CBS domain-containing protein [Succinivibrio sp.]